MDGVARDPHVSAVVLIAPTDPRWIASFETENPWQAAVEIAIRSDSRFELRREQVTPSGYRFLQFSRHVQE